MDPATLCYMIAFLSLASGVLMIVFRRTGGVLFCRFGRWSLSDFDSPWIRAQINDIYDEAKAPTRFFWIGVALVAQSPILGLFGYLLR